jgi:adenylosuccinate lyase
MKGVWEPENKYGKWLAIEISVCEALAQMGAIPREALEKIKRKAAFDLRRIEEIEAEVKHDVIAFLTAVSESIGDEGKYLHLGLTSSDVLDTGLALQLVEAADILLRDLHQLGEALREKAFHYKETPMIGRSHGIHAEPITFGLKMALWYEDNRRNIVRMERAKEVIAYGKISGAVGTFANTPPHVEEHVCSSLGLKPDPVSTQIIQRDRHAEYLSVLALIGGTLDKMATEIRHLQRTEVLEAEEFFSEGQKGSSAMPHKRNPVGCENISGLARIVRSNCMAGLENIPLWHERDISHSSVERVILPDSTILTDYMLQRMTGIIRGLQVYPENMLKNIHLTRGLIFSQRVLLALVEKGVERDRAYRLVQRNAMEAWKGEKEFQDLLSQDKEVRNILEEKEIHACFNLKYHFKFVDLIFARVFENNGRSDGKA